MVRKVIRILVIGLLLVGAMCAPAAAENYTAYDGNLSSTYTTYFRDILAGAKIGDNYVYFRSDQYTYSLVIGDLDYSSGVFTLAEPGKQYIINTSSSSYNSYYTYEVSDISSFSLRVENKIVYSDLGDFPQLEERGQKYEILQTVLIVIVCLCIVIRSILGGRKR